MSDHVFVEIMGVFVKHKTSVSSFIQYLLANPCFESSIFDLRAQANTLTRSFLQFANQSISDTLTYEISRRQLQNEVTQLLKLGTEWKFGASSLKANQIHDFRIDRMAEKLSNNAPHLWDLLTCLLSANSPISSQTNPSDSDACGLWADMDLEGIITLITSDGSTASKDKSRKQAVFTIKKVAIVSIIMQSSNQKTNALETFIGIFLHASKTPEKVIEAMSHLGISISLNSIHSAITSLSRESANKLREMGQSLSVAYAYDNFDVDLKSSVPTAQRSGTSLKHLTSALAFPLQHGVTPNDMKCSEELWKKSSINPSANPSDISPSPNLKRVILHLNEAYPNRDPKGLSPSQRFNKYKFLFDLCHYGPAYFAQFRSRISPPEVMDQIPIVKTSITPLRAMEYSNSTVSGNISTIENIMMQAGVGPPSSEESNQMDIDDTEEFSYEIKDGTLYVIMFRGDLSTGDRIMAIQLRRSLEKTPWSRFQYVIFVPGFFHVKMACVDSLHRLFVAPAKAREDDTSIMRDVGHLRPKQTGTVISKPGFCRMHQLILHMGICRRLDCWRVEVAKSNNQVKSIEDFAALKPAFEELEAVAESIVSAYVANKSFSSLRSMGADNRDQQYENALLFNKYSLLYEELSYAMNQGDIGRLENCMIPWIFIFWATGKHKYAKHMTLFLHNVYLVYPPALKKAVRLHMLVNPTGKAGKFRAVDWCVELNNLYTKAEHGGSSSNYTVDRIIKESPLVEEYRTIRNSIDQSFALNHLTSRHGDPDMHKTLKKLMDHVKTAQVHAIIPGRKSEHCLPDAIDEGRMKLMNGSSNDMDGNDEADEVAAELGDVISELVEI